MLMKLTPFLQIRDELSDEVTRLTEELEQMRTRVADLSKDARKNQVHWGLGIRTSSDRICSDRESLKEGLGIRTVYDVK